MKQTSCGLMYGPCPHMTHAASKLRGASQLSAMCRQWKPSRKLQGKARLTCWHCQACDPDYAKQAHHPPPPSSCWHQVLPCSDVVKPPTFNPSAATSQHTNGTVLLLGAAACCCCLLLLHFMLPCLDCLSESSLAVSTTVDVQLLDRVCCLPAAAWMTY